MHKAQVLATQSESYQQSGIDKKSKTEWFRPCKEVSPRRK